MINKIYSMLGLAMKAGKVVCGTDVCIENVKSKKAFLVVVANDASDNTKEKLKRICEQRKVKFVYFGNKFSLSAAAGKVDKAIYAVLDKGFSEKILQLVEEQKEAMD